MIILQTAGKGRYASPLISGRFQILESAIGKRFFVVDLLAYHTIPLAVDGSIKYFASIKDAEEWISLFTGTGVPRIEKRPYRTFKKGVEMKTNAKKAVPKKATRKTAAPVRKATRKAAPTARAPKQAARKAKVEVRKAVRGAVKTVLKAKRKGRGLSKSGTISATIREMILANKLTDEQILAETGKIFGRKIPTTAVKHYRDVLHTYGML